MGNKNGGRKKGPQGYHASAGVSVSAEQIAWLDKEVARLSAQLGWKVARSSIVQQLITERMQREQEE